MKSFSLFLISFLFFSGLAKAQTTSPNGYYSLDSKTTLKNGDTYGYFGTIKVKQVDSNRIFMEFYVCKGAPSYNSGSFDDTLHFEKGIAVYTTPVDNSCIITFNFNTAGGVTVEEKAKDLNAACGFGHAVVASGFYKLVYSGDPFMLR